MFEKSTAKPDSPKDTTAPEIWSILQSYARAVIPATHADEKMTPCETAEMTMGRAYVRRPEKSGCGRW